MKAQKTLVDNFKKNTQDYLNSEKKNLEHFIGNYADLNEKTVADIKKILDSDLPADLKQAIAAGMAQSPTNTDTTVTDSGSGGSGANTGMNFLKNMIDMLGQLGQVIQAVMSSNWIGLLIQFLASLSQSLSNQSESWNKLLNCMSTVTDVIAEIIGPIWEEIFKPFADGLEKIGQIVGQLLLPILQMVSDLLTPINTVFTEVLGFIAELVNSLAPFINLVGQLLTILNPIMPVLNMLMGVIRVLMQIITWAYNKILVPIINGLVIVFTTIANAFIWIYKKIYEVLNWIKLPTGINISWKGIKVTWKSAADLVGMKDKSYLNNADYTVSEISAESYLTTGENSSSGTTAGANTTTGASASYTAARDIYVTINYNNSYVNGDAREIALNLREEIRSAERLGL